MTDFCFHMDIAKVRFSRFVGANISQYENKATLPPDHYNKKDKQKMYSMIKYLILLLC